MKKILLTGESTDQLAISAFNECIIDCFIRKDNLSLTYDIRCYLQILTQQYIANNTKQLSKHLEIDRPLPISDPEFITFFKEWCHTHRIQEYFLIDLNANFLLVDESNEYSFFVTHTDYSLNKFIDLHDDDNKAIPFINSVKLREKVPFFGEGKESWNIDHQDWSARFLAPQILIGREKYYWMVFNN